MDVAARVREGVEKLLGGSENSAEVLELVAKESWPERLPHMVVPTTQEGWTALAASPSSRLRFIRHSSKYNMETHFEHAKAREREVSEAKTLDNFLWFLGGAGSLLGFFPASKWADVPVLSPEVRGFLLKPKVRWATLAGVLGVAAVMTFSKWRAQEKEYARRDELAVANAWFRT